MNVRDRVRELRRVRAGELLPHPKNWRRHPAHQRAALQGVMKELGCVTALVAREQADGSLLLLDGHLRADLNADAELPVLVLDVSEEEGERILASLDPLSAMAEGDQAAWRNLLASWTTSDTDLQATLAQWRRDEEQAQRKINASEPREKESCFEGLFQIVVHCENEAKQRELFEELQSQGWTCRLVVL